MKYIFKFLTVPFSIVLILLLLSLLTLIIIIRSLWDFKFYIELEGDRLHLHEIWNRDTFYEIEWWNLFDVFKTKRQISNENWSNHSAITRFKEDHEEEDENKAF